ncbi:l-3-72Do [Drosophila busckii]|uniref:L-3-72Do n=1 Tax=Drosophila busckii TaxID=30019 RepID=A0A0M5J0L4_DROBS|nr:co-chaperone protein HscB homolog [Drosophila busckii]ALC43936.1 l-3-72Do [Drosophila busckii]
MRRITTALNTAYTKVNYKQSTNNYAAHYRLQQQRFATLSASASTCWNCQKQQQNMICASCGSLQDVNNQINYFELLSFPTKFTMQQQELTQRFRQLQARVHPDKYSNKSDREQSNSADWSSLINKAYKTLATPMERGQYMLQLEGEQMPQDNSALNKEFLMDMMERNEEVEDAEDAATLQQLNVQLLQELEAHAQKLHGHFEAKDLVAVKATLVEMKYLLSIQASIKQKQQQLLGS